MKHTRKIKIARNYNFLKLAVPSLKGYTEKINGNRVAKVFLQNVYVFPISINRL